MCVYVYVYVYICVYHAPVRVRLAGYLSISVIWHLSVSGGYTF